MIVMKNVVLQYGYVLSNLGSSFNQFNRLISYCNFIIERKIAPRTCITVIGVNL